MEYKAVKGTRDFAPMMMQRRNYIFDTIRKVYKAHGFLQIETPALESLNTLMGKYGEEGDKLLFKILDSGVFLKKEKLEEFSSYIDSESVNKATTMICEKGLRYDLTVPFARFVVNHRNDIVFPFKRFQIQPVWRADRPQKGRYREFYQCDADIIGSDSLMNEVELLQIISEVFDSFGLKVRIKLNNRKILAAIAEIVGQKERLTDITVAIDKLDKIGIENVLLELKDKGLTQEQCEKILPFMSLEGSNEEIVDKLSKAFADNQTGQKGLQELSFVVEKARKASIDNLDIDITLARGLNYYTGAILEVKAEHMNMGSISGGGRYDNLTGIFGMPDVSGVGISFGADRIYDCLEEKDLFPKDLEFSTQVLFINFGDLESEKCVSLSSYLRNNNVSCEVYPDSAKLKKQMKYANDRNFPFVVLVGEQELLDNTCVVKNMTSGEQQTVKTEDILSALK